MGAVSNVHYWDVWYPKAAATGVSIGRAVVEPTGTMLLHAAGDIITVEVRDARGARIALGTDLPRTLESPMCRLRLDGPTVTREDIWPTDADVGELVMLPGGEVGRLLEWWNAEDRRAWRWRVEFSNHLD